MKRSLTVIFLVFASLFLFSSTAQAAPVKGSNTKLEADKLPRGIWKLKLCTRISVNREQKVTMRTLSKQGNQVLRMLKYMGSKKDISKVFWPNKSMRCYRYVIYTKSLSKQKATLVRKFFQLTNKPKVLVSIGYSAGTVTLNV